MQPDEAPPGHLQVKSARANVHDWTTPAKMSRIGSAILQMLLLRRLRMQKERNSNRVAANPNMHENMPANCANL